MLRRKSKSVERAIERAGLERVVRYYRCSACFARMRPLVIPGVQNKPGPKPLSEKKS